MKFLKVVLYCCFFALSLTAVEGNSVGGYNPQPQWTRTWIWSASKNKTDALSNGNWTSTGGATFVSGEGLRFCSPSMMSFTIPADSWSPPSAFSMTSVVSGVNVEKPSVSWLGVKMMFSFQDGYGSSYNINPPGPYGNFTNITLTKEIGPWKLPLKHGNILIGTQGVSGCVTFHSLKLVFYAMPNGWNYESGVSTRLRGAMSSTSLSKTDFEDFGMKNISSWHGNTFRWQINDRRFWTANISHWYVIMDENLDHLDSLLPIAKENGIYILLDLHTNPGPCEEANNVCQLQSSPKLQQGLIDLWVWVTKRYKGNYRPIFAFDILNEPNFNWANKTTDWPSFAKRIALAIAKEDPERYIVIPEPLPVFPVPIPHIIYTTHVYTPHCMTHQFVISGYDQYVYYPNSTLTCSGRTGWDKEAIRNHVVREIHDFSEMFHIPVIVGEFSCIRWAPNGSGYRYLKDVIEIFEEYGWSWMYHAFREWSGWSVEHSDIKEVQTKTTTPTQRKQLLLSYFALNKNPYDDNAKTLGSSFSSITNGDQTANSSKIIQIPLLVLLFIVALFI